VAALIAVPLPFNTPEMVVDSVIAGVVVAVATDPANPFDETTETLVTVPLLLKVFQSILVKYPSTDVVAAGILITGVKPPEDTTGGKPVTLVTPSVG
jgi:hypothetical protein